MSRAVSQLQSLWFVILENFIDQQLVGLSHAPVHHHDYTQHSSLHDEQSMSCRQRDDIVNECINISGGGSHQQQMINRQVSVTCHT